MKKKIIGIFALCFIAAAGFGQGEGYWHRQRSRLNKHIWSQYYMKQEGLFREKLILKPGDKRLSYLWPICALLQAANETDKHDGGDEIFSRISAIALAYLDTISPPMPAFDSYVVRFGGDDRFYDDNQWLGIAYADAYGRTRNEKYLEQAVAIYRYMMSGWDTVGGGGIYWKEGDRSTKNTCSNGPGAVLAMHLYTHTGERTYLDTAIMIYNWVDQYLKDDDHLYFDALKLPGKKLDTRKFTYNAGTMLEASVQLYRVTKDTMYLHRAKAIAASSLSTFYRNESYPDNDWFNAVLFRGYLALYQVSNDPVYVNSIRIHAKNVCKKGLTKPSVDLLDKGGLLEILARLDWLDGKAKR